MSFLWPMEAVNLSTNNVVPNETQFLWVRKQNIKHWKQAVKQAEVWMHCAIGSVTETLVGKHSTTNGCEWNVEGYFFEESHYARVAVKDDMMEDVVGWYTDESISNLMRLSWICCLL